MTSAAVDPDFMEIALRLARRAVGQAGDNPPVGCVIVDFGAGAGRIVGRGWTQPGGRPHAETQALARAQAAARGATAYVTLEPCSHHGRTPPCARALIDAGISRVVAAMEDPYREVRGTGFAALRAAGLEVSVGLCAAAAAEVARGFIMRQTMGRPWITLKLAATLDGRIATQSGDSRWITGPRTRALVHGLRARHDAIMVGIGTVEADDPALTCRLAGLEDRAPARVVLDTRLKVSPQAKALAGDGARRLVFTNVEAQRPSARRLAQAGVEVVQVPTGRGGRLDLPKIFQALASRGVNTVLVEGGGILAAALLRGDLVDELHWHSAPAIIGGDGRAAVAAMGIRRLTDGLEFEPITHALVGGDSVAVLRPKRGKGK